jgi:hypothetical protein
VTVASSVDEGQVQAILALLSEKLSKDKSLAIYQYPAEEFIA